VGHGDKSIFLLSGFALENAIKAFLAGILDPRDSLLVLIAQRRSLPRARLQSPGQGQPARLNDWKFERVRVPRKPPRVITGNAGSARSCGILKRDLTY
jgi:hypothetical protein